MKALAHVILHQLLFRGVVAGHVGAVLHAGVHASDRTSHRRAVRVLIPTAVIMRRLCSDPRFARWLDEQRQ